MSLQLSRIGFAGFAFALLGQSALAQSTDSSSSYGVLAQTVAISGSLIAAAAAITLCWKGRFKWEPAEEDIPKSAQKAVGLLVAVAIAIIWFKFTQELSLDPKDLIIISYISSGAMIAGLLCYSLLIGVLVYDKTYVVSGKKTAQRKIIGGLWLSEAAKEALRSGDPRPLTIQDLLKGAAFNEDFVWPRFGRALAKTLFQLAYVVLIAGGTCALATTSMLVSSVVQP